MKKNQTLFSNKWSRKNARIINKKQTKKELENAKNKKK
jgi:hypothetical protein